MNYEEFINDPRFNKFLTGICFAYNIPFLGIDRTDPNRPQFIFETTNHQVIIDNLLNGKLEIDKKKVLEGMKKAIKLIYTT